MKLPQDVPIGSVVELYLNDSGEFVGGTGTNTIAATVVMEYNYGERISYVVAWRRGERKPANVPYNYHHDRTGMLMFFGISDPYKKPSHPNYPKIHPNLPEFAHAVFVPMGCEIVAVHGPDYNLGGAGGVVSKSHGPLPYITASDIQSGDLVAIASADTDLGIRGVMNYIIVSDVSEGEDIAGEPHVVLDGIVYSEEGQLSYPNGYYMAPNRKVLLVKRCNNA